MVAFALYCLSGCGFQRLADLLFISLRYPVIGSVIHPKFDQDHILSALG